MADNELEVRSQVMVITPFEQPNARLVLAVARAGGLGVLDLGHDTALARRELSELARSGVAFGVRISTAVSALPLPAAVGFVVLPDPVSVERRLFGERRVFVQVCSLDEARRATKLGADALIVKGDESGGRVGDQSAFVLLQQIAAEATLPLWLQGGIGVHTAAAAIAGGACGVVLDSQVALLSEARVRVRTRALLRTMDGSETVVLNGWRSLRAVVSARSQAAAAEASETVAAGMDAAFALPLSRRFGTVAALVNGIEAAIAGHLKQAKAARPLAQGSGFAKRAGLKYPIVQGPMTRVSDRSEFAVAVAEAGALPFVALSLMRGDETRSLLRALAERLDGRSWGVGILGFAPEEIRGEQLAAIAECGPPYALIAGGRPAQAHSLEQQGIKTFLHVPSPGLLDLFLREGARRFVFEGRECGGHVGPRSSFVLWEQAVSRLSQLDDLNEIEVLFAGGIHDARSAAMVAALCAPLCARGASVGVLIGTAYLFTDEAVATGAVTAEFQHQASACEHTVLLETASGHATRAAVSAYTDEFERTRQRMFADGTDPKAIWAALEQLNLGRLRVASKGLAREHGALVALDDAAQRREGLFMMGQVAALRTRVTSMAALHRELSEDATRLIDRFELPDNAAERNGIDIAIVGLACLFPDAENSGRYFENILSGRNCVHELPDARWNKQLYYAAEGGRDKTPSKWGGLLPEIQLEPQRYGIPPRAMGSIDPGQLLSLIVAERALADAGLDSAAIDRERTSVIFGAEAGTEMAAAYIMRCSYPQLMGALPEELEAQLPDLTEDSFPGVLANVIAGRIANRLDLGGTNYTVNAACASSLAAVDAACKELATGSADVVIAGATDVHNGAYDYLMFASAHALSRDGACKAFDRSADGIVLGEGVAALVLKRREDAEHDGDRIYAVLRAVAGSSDGRSLGLTAPRKEGQERALERAYAQAGLSPNEVTLLEAHGTGTVAGDRTELAALTRSFVDAGAAPRSCTLGSVKSSIGHTKCAAGMAGLIKTALSIHHGVLPPTAQLEQPNAYYDSQRSPFVFRKRPAPWLSERRVAAVSAFGFGGTNFHAVLQSHAAAAQPARDWPAELFLFRGQDRNAAFDQMRGLLAALDSSECALSELAASAEAISSEQRVQVAFVASSQAELRDKLARALAVDRAIPGLHFADADWRDARVAFLFPGQGSQYVDMGAALFTYLPHLRQRFLEHPDLVAKLFPGQAFTREEEAEQHRAITDTRVAQPCIGLIELALAELLELVGVRADLAGGHSYGELVALAYAGALERDALVELSRERGAALHASPAGAMAAVEAAPAEVEAVLAGAVDVVIANYNAPRQTVISGAAGAVSKVVSELQSRGMIARSLPVSGAFHSPLQLAAEREFARTLEQQHLCAPRIPVWSNVSGEPHDGDPGSLAAALAHQLVAPVRFESQLRSMYREGARIFVEVGPRTVLTALVNATLADVPHRAFALDSNGHGELPALLDALGRLAVCGIPMQLGRVFELRGVARVDLSASPAKPASHTAWWVSGHLARPAHGQLPASALKPCLEPLHAAAQKSQPAGESSMLEYLRNMRELAEQQSQIMLRSFGAALPVSVSDFAPKAVLELATLPATAEQPSSDANGAPDPASLLRQLISERTGYPEEILDPELDLEADLGIDSIKRTEIVGSLAERLGLDPSARRQASEQLIARRSLREMLEWIETELAIESPAASSNIYRYLPEWTAVAPPARAFEPRGQRIVVSPDTRGVARELVADLERSGTRACVLDAGVSFGPNDALICLEGLNHPIDDVTATVFSHVQRALACGCSWIVAATAATPLRTSAECATETACGISGLLKSAARECSGLRVRTVECDAREVSAAIARSIAFELTDAEAESHVRHIGGERRSLRLGRAALPDTETDFGIDSESVVMVTGGARGITASCALALAKRFGCRLELIGSTPAPLGIEDDDTRRATTPEALRRAFAARGIAAREIDQHWRRVLKERELRATFAALDHAGVAHGYHAVDVRSEVDFSALIDALYTEHGRLDGVIHGAGVIDDRLLPDKSASSFARVFDTKVRSARTILRKLRTETRFVAFFSSISGVLGSRGQADYAAANACLDELALAQTDATRSGTRVVSIAWGPWKLGMVDETLARSFEARGVALIEPQLGTQAFIDELTRGDSPQVVLTASSVESWCAGG